MFSDSSNDARTDKTNEADGDHKNVEEEHTTAPMVPIEKKVLLALHRLIEFNSPGICDTGDVNKAIRDSHENEYV